MTPLQITLEGPSLLRFAGDLDHSNEGQVTDAFAAIPGPLRLDMSGVTFMDSSGLRLLLLRSSYGPLTCVATSSAVRRVLDVAGMRLSSDGRLASGAPDVDAEPEP